MYTIITKYIVQCTFEYAGIKGIVCSILCMSQRIKGPVLCIVILVIRIKTIYFAASLFYISY